MVANELEIFIGQNWWVSSYGIMKKTVSWVEAKSSLHSISLSFIHLLLFPNTDPSGSVKRPMGKTKKFKLTNILCFFVTTGQACNITCWELLDKVREGKGIVRMEWLASSRVTPTFQTQEGLLKASPIQQEWDPFLRDQRHDPGIRDMTELLD